MWKNTKRKRPAGQTHEYWQSYSDMMAALLLMFVLIMAFTLAQSLKNYEDKISLQNEQQAQLDEQQAQLDAQQEKIDDLIGVKSNIIKELGKTFQDSNLSIDIDKQTGAISLDSKVLFAYNSSALSQEGIAFLKNFLPLYISVLLDDSYQRYVSEIIIEGHTDTDGNYMYNLNLSQERAYSVAAYCLDERNGLLPMLELEDLRNVMTANGKSFSNPVYDESGKVDAVKSRRVEIKFRLQDEEMISQLQEILDGVDA